MPISTRSRSGATSSSASAAAAPTPAAPAPLSARPTISRKRTKKQKAPAAAAAKIAVSKKLPDVTLTCDDGQPRQILSLLTDETPGMILFTYPRANTPGCTTQACGLSTLAADSKKAGYITVGASYDSVKSQASWRIKHTMQVEHLLCDTLDIGLLKKIGAHKAPKSVKRCVFVIRRGGKDSTGDDAVIVESRILISPKDSITFVEQYIKDNPCKGEAEPAAAMTDSSAPETATPEKSDKDASGADTNEPTNADSKENSKDEKDNKSSDQGKKAAEKKGEETTAKNEKMKDTDKTQ